MELNLLTYNIHGLPWCMINVASIADWIFERTSSDIICLQEVFSKNHRKIINKKAEAKGWNVYYPEDYCWLGCLRGIECGSGLAVLVHPSIQVTEQPEFTKFLVNGGVDRMVTKGFFKLHCRRDGKDFIVVNTHCQSDLTDIPFIRINYPKERDFQVFQMYSELIHSKSPVILIGDMNQATFKWFERLDPIHHITFPQTGEHLDHALFLKRDSKKIKHISTHYFDSISLSDHIPVLINVSLYPANGSS